MRTALGAIVDPDGYVVISASILISRATGRSCSNEKSAETTASSDDDLGIRICRIVLAGLPRQYHAVCIRPGGRPRFRYTLVADERMPSGSALR